MRLLLYFLLTSGLGFSQANTQNCQVNESSYKVIVKENAYPGYDSKVVIARTLTTEELCLIKTLRREEETITYSLDEIYEVLIYAKNMIKGE